MRAMKNKIKSVALALVAFSGVHAFAAGETIIFDHAKHLNDVGITCADCHFPHKANVPWNSPKIPGMDVCGQCHYETDVKPGSKECYMCHTDKKFVIKRTRDFDLGIQDLSYKFDHDKHMEMQPKCDACHVKIASSAAATDNNYPRHEQCTACHDIGPHGDLK